MIADRPEEGADQGRTKVVSHGIYVTYGMTRPSSPTA
jgi:hypothetical protein